jgi:hypothetical protein
MLGAQLVRAYQFKVALRGISPMIWRRLLLRSDHSVAGLRCAIQIVMGWSDSQLHRFHIHAKDVGVRQWDYKETHSEVICGQIDVRGWTKPLFRVNPNIR